MEVGGTHENSQYPIWTGDPSNEKKKKCLKFLLITLQMIWAFPQNSTEY